MLEDNESGYRAKSILLKDEEYTVPEIRKITNHHDHNIRKWIHRFSEKGIDGIISKKHNHKQHKFDNDLEKQIVDIVFANPRSFNLGFSTWSLRVLGPVNLRHYFLIIFINKQLEPLFDMFLHLFFLQGK